MLTLKLVITFITLIVLLRCFYFLLKPKFKVGDIVYFLGIKEDVFVVVQSPGLFSLTKKTYIVKRINTSKTYEAPEHWFEEKPIISLDLL